MIQKSLNVSLASVVTILSVTATTGSAGQGSGISTKSVVVQVSNARTGGPIEFKAGSAAWILLDEEAGQLVEIDLSTTQLLLRKASPTSGPCQVTLEAFSIDSFVLDGRYKISGFGGGTPVTLQGASGVGQVATAILADGWTFDSVQWKKNVSGAVSNATGAGATTLNYTQVSADVVPGVRIYPDFSNLRYIATMTASATAPGAPTIGTATAGDGTVFIAFSAPASDGGSAIIDYLVTLSDGSTVTTASIPAAFVGKTNGLSYTGAAKARNSVGYGASSASSNAVIPSSGAATLTISGTPSTSATVGAAYSFTPATAGGTGSKTFALIAGALPAGLSLNTATGSITGTPTTAATASGLSLRVTDSGTPTPQTATLATFSITVAAAVVNSKARFGTGTATAGVSSPAALLAAMAEYGTVNASKAGSFNVVAGGAGVYGWAAIEAGASASGVTFTDTLGTGGWQGASSSGNNGTDPGVNPNTSTVTYTDGNGVTWRFFRLNYANATWNGTTS